MSDQVLRLSGVSKVYGVGTPAEFEVLHDIELTLNGGDFAALVGPSGSGKSTLLNIIGLLDRPTAGELHLLGEPTRAMSDVERTELRNRAIGFVFQFHHLIPAFSVLDNVLMPLMIRHGKPSAAERERARALLVDVGLSGCETKRPTEISGGQQQRVAIARALVTEPALLLADEPTGNLDTQTAETVFALLQRFHAEYHCAVLVVTHDPQLAANCRRTIELVDGRIIRDQPRA